MKYSNHQNCFAQEKGALLLLLVFFLASLLAIAQVSLQRIVGFELGYTQRESQTLAQDHAARYALLQTMNTGQDGLALFKDTLIIRQALHARLPLQNRFLINRSHHARSSSTPLIRWSHARALAVAQSCYFKHPPNQHQFSRCLARPKPIIFIESNVRLTKALLELLLQRSAVLLSTGTIVMTELMLPEQSHSPQRTVTLLAADSIHLEDAPEEVCTTSKLLDPSGQDFQEQRNSSTRTAHPQSSQQQLARLQLYAAGAKIVLPREGRSCLTECRLSVRAAQGVFEHTHSHSQSIAQLQVRMQECAFTFNSPLWTLQKRSVAFLTNTP